VAKPRSAVFAGISNLIAPPLGHIYLGMPKRGFVILISGILIIAALGWMGAAETLWGFYIAQGVYLLVIVLLIIDGVIQSRRHKDYELKKYNRWYVYVGLFVVLIVSLNILMTFRSYVFGFDNHRNVSSNMAPTLKPGELIATDTRGYLIGFNHKRGQIITFRYPKDPSITYVKRIVGLPGERVEIKGAITYIDGVPISEPYISNEVTKEPYSVDMKEVIVPPDSLFVLGDNRDNSNDSRFWGFLQLSNVKGIVTAIWYSPETDRISSGINDNVE